MAGKVTSRYTGHASDPCMGYFPSRAVRAEACLYAGPMSISVNPRKVDEHATYAPLEYGGPWSAAAAAASWII